MAAPCKQFNSHGFVVAEVAELFADHFEVAELFADHFVGFRHVFPTMGKQHLACERRQEGIDASGPSLERVSMRACSIYLKEI